MYAKGVKLAFVAHKEEDDGPAHPQTRSAVHRCLEAASTDLSTVWQFLADRVHHSAEGSHLGGDFPTQSSHQSMPHPHMSSLSCSLSSRRGGQLRASAWRIWPGSHCPHWRLALPGASQCPRDASTPTGPRVGDLGTSGDPKARTATRELVSLHITDCERIAARLQKQGQVIVALDGFQPDVGHEVLWVVRDCHTARDPAGASVTQSYPR